MINWKEYLAKYFTNLVSVITLFGGVVFIYNYYQDKEREKAERLLLEERYGKLIGQRDESQALGYATQLATAYKEQAELAKEAKEAWQQLAKEREERIKSMSTTIVTVDPKAEEQPKSDYNFETPDKTNGYTLNELRIDGKDSPPIGYVMIKKDGSVAKRNYQFELHIENIELKDDLTGKIRVVSRAFLVPLEDGLADKRRPDFKKWKGEKYPLNVTGGEIVVDPKDPMNPNVSEKGLVSFPMNINVGLGLFSGKDAAESNMKGMADTNLFGWGYNKRDLDWKILHLGVNYNDDGGVGFHVMPFSYRVLPGILTNTYIGPGYHIDSKKSGFLIGVNAGL